ncbi:MAG TPA: hypothetical protein VFE51_21135 [Verrucomicrobiae bacterium]|nr:hypothetical protein [Verrucomicrobiae bacterium]
MARKSKKLSAAVNCWRRLPFRLATEQFAGRVNCDTDAVRFIIDAKLIKPLANPAKGAPMFFATVEVEELGKDVRWLEKVSKVIREKVKAKNEKRTKKGETS